MVDVVELRTVCISWLGKRIVHIEPFVFSRALLLIGCMSCCRCMSVNVSKPYHLHRTLCSLLAVEESTSMHNLLRI
jgi:hypothetical protein